MDLKFIKQGHPETEYFNSHNVEAIERQYANAANYLDRSLQELFDGLARRGILDNTLIIIMGDHPDSFFENGLLGHAWTLDEHQRRTSVTIVNGAGHYTAPIDQMDLARIVVNSLDTGNQESPLKVDLDPNKKVFVLTGELENPRQFGWISAKDLYSYDFRINKAKPGNNSKWMNPEDLADSTQKSSDFIELVNTWESYDLKRQQGKKTEMLALHAEIHEK
jgi:hypothetical protein